ncbi:hypothetical protein KIPB_016539, partial [Kipferlia bialata]
DLAHAPHTELSPSLTAAIEGATTHAAQAAPANLTAPVATPPQPTPLIPETNREVPVTVTEPTEATDVTVAPAAIPARPIPPGPEAIREAEPTPVIQDATTPRTPPRATTTPGTTTNATRKRSDLRCPVNLRNNKQKQKQADILSQHLAALDSAVKVAKDDALTTPTRAHFNDLWLAVLERSTTPFCHKVKESSTP